MKFSLLLIPCDTLNLKTGKVQHGAQKAGAVDNAWIFPGFCRQVPDGRRAGAVHAAAEPAARRHGRGAGDAAAQHGPGARRRRQVGHRFPLAVQAPDAWMEISPGCFELCVHGGVGMSARFMSPDCFAGFSPAFLRAGGSTRKCWTPVLVVFGIERTQLSSHVRWFSQVQWFSVNSQGQISRIRGLEIHNLWECNHKGTQWNILLKLR